MTLLGTSLVTTAPAPYLWRIRGKAFLFTKLDAINNNGDIAIKISKERK